MPRTRSIERGPTPAPAHAPPEVHVEEVTNGYVPWSMSSSVPCAPSNSTHWSAESAVLMTCEVSAMCGLIRSA